MRVSKSASNKKYRESHKKQISEGKKIWYWTNRERVLAHNQEYRKRNKEKLSQRYFANADKEKAETKAWRAAHPEHNKRTKDRQNAIRRHEFGFLPMNDCFADSEAHHVDRERIIYIPKKLHRSVSHSIIRNRNMDIINNLAFTFLRGES